MSEQLFLIAHIADHALAFSSQQIESVVDLDTIIPVPRAGAHILGLAALRSRVVTVIDTRSALGLDATSGPGLRAVIVAQGGHHYALVVDTLDDVAAFSAMPLEAGIALANGWKSAARGLIERDGEPVLILDPAALIPTGSESADLSRPQRH